MSVMSILMMQLSFHRQLFSQKEIRIICFRVAWLLYVFSKSQVLPISKLTFWCNSAVSVCKQRLSHVARMFWVYRNVRMFRCFWWILEWIWLRRRQRPCIGRKATSTEIHSFWSEGCEAVLPAESLWQGLHHHIKYRLSIYRKTAVSERC